MPAPTTVPGPARDPLLRNLLGRVLREERTAQRRTLADVARDSRVSLPHLSEVERGRKEPSSEVLAAICTALDLTILEVLRRSAGLLAPLEVTVAPSNPALSGPAPFHPGRSTSTGVQLSLVA